MKLRTDPDATAIRRLRDEGQSYGEIADERGNIVETDLALSAGNTIKVYMLNEHYSVAHVEPKLTPPNSR